MDESPGLDDDAAGTDAGQPSTSRLVKVAAPTGLFVLVALIVWNPWHFRRFENFPALIIPVLLGVAGLVLAEVLRRHGPRQLAAWCAVTALVLLMTSVIRPISASLLPSRGTQVAATRSADDRYELVVRHWVALIDDAYDVKLRRVHGVLPEEVLVWRGVEYYDQPSARFVDGSTIEVTAAESGASPKVYEAHVDSKPLRVSPVYCLSESNC